jgi:YVTN family beta-propeller protein
MKFYKFLLIATFGALFLYSCSNDDDAIVIIDPVEPDETFAFENGFLVTNQGPFNTGFGSVDFVNADVTTIDNDIYQDVNADNLGNVVQSIGFSGDLAYVVANISNRITVVNRFTFEEVARIETGLENPRYFIEANGKGYVSNWGDPFVTTDDYIAVIDLTTNQVTGTIPVGEGPEEMLFNRFNLYVANKGGFGVNNTLTVIDPTTDMVASTINVGDVPNSLQLDTNGNLWVLSEGSPAFTGNETAGTLTRINTDSNQIITTFVFGMTEHPNYLNIFGDDLYYFLGGDVFKTTTASFETSTTPILSGVNFFNMFVVNNGATLIGCNAADFASIGTLEVYNLQDNTLTTTLSAGIIPDNVYVNP